MLHSSTPVAIRIASIANFGKYPVFTQGAGRLQATGNGPLVGQRLAADPVGKKGGCDAVALGRPGDALARDLDDARAVGQRNQREGNIGREMAADDLQVAITARRKLIQSKPMIPMLKHIVASETGDEQWLQIRPPLLPLASEDAQTVLTSLAA